MFLIFLALPLSAIGGDFYCAEQIQRCAHEELETRVQFLKERAFESCIKRPACHQEKTAFDVCYKSSLRSMRSTFLASNESALPFFEGTLNEYRKELDHCFESSPRVPIRSHFGPSLVDEDAVYSRGLFGGELADRLWGLPELTTTRPSLDTLAVCRLPDPPRVFGTGISRILHSGDPKLNNISSSCLLEDSELICYRQQLDSNPEYIQAVYQRDYAIRSCLQQLRVQTPCRLRDHSRLRSCVCGVRTRFDKMIESNILKCMEEMSVTNKVLIKAALHDFDSEKILVDVEKPMKTLGMKSPSLTRGELVNGQCMCSCQTTGFTQHMTTVSAISSVPEERPNQLDPNRGGPRFRKAPGIGGGVGVEEQQCGGIGAGVAPCAPGIGQGASYQGIAVGGCIGGGAAPQECVGNGAGPQAGGCVAAPVEEGIGHGASCQ